MKKQTLRRATTKIKLAVAGTTMAIAATVATPATAGIVLSEGPSKGIVLSEVKWYQPLLDWARGVPKI